MTIFLQSATEGEDEDATDILFDKVGLTEEDITLILMGRSPGTATPELVNRLEQSAWMRRFTEMVSIATLCLLLIIWNTLIMSKTN